MARNNREYLLVRCIKTDEVRIAPIVGGWKPKPDPEFTWAGPYKSKKAAEEALASGEAETTLWPELAKM